MANLPIYKVLGAYRNKVRAYASVIPTDHAWTVEEYEQNALECKARGFPAYKLHIRGTPKEHSHLLRGGMLL